MLFYNLKSNSLQTSTTNSAFKVLQWLVNVWREYLDVILKLGLLWIKIFYPLKFLNLWRWQEEKIQAWILKTQSVFNISMLFRVEEMSRGDEMYSSPLLLSFKDVL